MKFPVTIRHRTSKVKICGPKKKFDHYRIAYTIAGTRRMQTFPSYSEAHSAAGKLAEEIHEGSQVAALSATTARDALAAVERLEEFHRATGRRASLLAAVSEFAEAATKLGGRSLAEAVASCLATAATVQRKDAVEAVEEFLKARELRSRAWALRDSRFISSLPFSLAGAVAAVD